MPYKFLREVEKCLIFSMVFIEGTNHRALFFLPTGNISGKDPDAGKSLYYQFNACPLNK